MKKFCIQALAYILFAVWSAGAGHAANIILDRTTFSTPVIVIDGDFNFNDDKTFNNLAISVDQALIVFNSQGGLAGVGISIGRTIAIKGFSTLVLPNSMCASACALAWLAGHPRSLFPTSKVGFHAIYTTDNGSHNVSSAGNAVVGSYLHELGMTDREIIYITETQPDSMAWLSQEAANAIGLEVKLLSEASSTDANAASTDNIAPIPAPADRQNQSANAGISNNPAVTTLPTANQWSLLPNTDLLGFDITPKPMTAGTVDQCQAACQNDARCTAFTFNESHKACFLKSSANQALQFTGALSGYKTSNNVVRIGRDYGPNVDFRTFQGSEITAMPYSTYMNKTLAWCQDECVDDMFCKAFTFYKNGICVKFHQSKPAQRNSEVFSGIKTD
jgi:hypothetical protein